MMDKTTEKYDELKYGELSDRVMALDDTHARSLLFYLIGFCKYDDHFLTGVESGLVEYSRVEGDK